MLRMGMQGKSLKSQRMRRSMHKTEMDKDAASEECAKFRAWHYPIAILRYAVSGRRDALLQFVEGKMFRFSRYDCFLVGKIRL